MQSAKFAPQARPTRNPVKMSKEQIQACKDADAWLQQAGMDTRTGLPRPPRTPRKRHNGKVIPVTFES